MNASTTPGRAPEGIECADERHARTRILRRTIDMYDQRRSWFPEELESVSRELAIDWLSRTARIDDIRAAELIAEALAARAARRYATDRLASRATKRLGE